MVDHPLLPDVVGSAAAYDDDDDNVVDDDGGGNDIKSSDSSIEFVNLKENPCANIH